MKVLVTGAGALIGQGIIKSLRLSALDCEIIGADPSPLAAGLYRCHKAYLVPMAHAPHFLEELLRILRRERVDAVLVGTDVELGVLAAHRQEIEAETGAKVLVSAPEVIAIADDKWQTYRFLKEHGFPYPESCVSTDVGSFVERVPFPLVVKPRIGARSINLHIVRNQRELDHALSVVENPIIQECLLPDTQEYTVGALVLDRQCVGVIAMKRDLRDGNTFRAFVDDYPDVTHTVRQLALALNPYGPANFQLRHTAKGPTVFEINARFSGTTLFRAAVGFNEVEAILRRVVLGEVLEPLTYRKGIILRYFNELVLSFEEYERLAQTGCLENPKSETLNVF